MKSLLKKVSLMVAMLALTANNALAQSGFFNNPQGGTAAPDVTTKLSLGDAVVTVLNWFLGILGLVAVVMVVYAGFELLTSQGNEEAAGKAKKIITYAGAGLLLIIFAWTIVQFVVNALTS